MKDLNITSMAITSYRQKKVRRRRQVGENRDVTQFAKVVIERLLALARAYQDGSGPYSQRRLKVSPGIADAGYTN
jgi:hypothetical protein